jgi:hypothetical protein
MTMAPNATTTIVVGDRLMLVIMATSLQSDVFDAWNGPFEIALAVRRGFWVTRRVTAAAVDSVPSHGSGAGRGRIHADPARCARVLGEVLDG